MMHPGNLFRGRYLWAGLALYMIWWVLPLTLEREWLFDLMNGLYLALGGGALVAFAPGVWKILRTGTTDRGSLMALGVFTFTFGGWCRTLYVWQWRLRGQPVDGYYDLNHPILAFFVFVICMAYVLTLAAYDAEETGKIPSKYWARIGVLTSIGLAIAIALIYFDLNLG